MRHAIQIFTIALALCALLAPAGAFAIETRVAVAANFSATLRVLAVAFEKSHGQRVLISTGSTGRLYAQILHGAPYDLFLAADTERPRLLSESGHSEAPFTYALGQLVLVGHASDPAPPGQRLARGEFRRLAIANPKTAPYGLAATHLLERLGLDPASEGRIVRGESVLQAHQFVITGNADLGVVAHSLVALDDGTPYVTVDPGLYDPIRQDAVLLARGRDNPTALAFAAYLRSHEARAIIERYGYRTVADE